MASAMHFVAPLWCMYTVLSNAERVVTAADWHGETSWWRDGRMRVWWGEREGIAHDAKQLPLAALVHSLAPLGPESQHWSG